MAIVTIALPLTGIRGTIAGIVFSANHNGPYAKGWSPCTNPTTIGQVWQRAQLAEAGRLWRTLTTAHQNNWDTFAKTPPETDYNSLHKIYLLSGFGWFTRILLRRRRCGLSDDLIAPASTPTTAPTTFLLDLHPSTGAPTNATFYYTSGEFATYYAILQLSIAPGLGSNTQTSRYLNLWENVGLTAVSTDFGPEYYSAFGDTQVDMRFFARLYRQSPSGIRSVPKELFTDVFL